MPTADSAVAVRTADEATWADLCTVFGSRGVGARCWCQRYKLAPRESFGSVPTEDRAARLREQTDCDHPGASSTSGLVGYLGDEPVGWCAVEPRPHFGGLTRVFRVPWDGRNEDRSDLSIWAVTCLFTRAGFRRRGVSRALARAAVQHARNRGASALEAYPTTTSQVTQEELHVGNVSIFTDAGLEVVSRPTLRRAVMRIDF